ncbi:SigE family RNA polymerase sigma factor [Stackebrandtia nassauensis]|uniref:RNA polymerase, sigma-24 subunit, ECF subfamily n=1 Tax=Stackebrandtia nassauensis (strain DSM 44728 / CIP 108903 / NRRL B-16338 / NBRC 102104 / LLR-40K-21) TaxID=446470 RepID=D3Q1G3_STANL|nr:SigE family RNA polymerase sigma factor [Stackebrandtia nassauensis]ADD45743.1 RNA polymerase, sigma-24 subunit, ECF subfamily [Stackebrandtia nassauensis DSM 44728]
MYQRPPPNPRFDEFVRARSASLLRAAFLLTGGDQHQAEDLVQSALARTLRAWSRLEREDNAEAYTRKTMYHLQVGWWRRRARERRANKLLHPQEIVADGADDVLRRLALKSVLRRLTPKQRAVLVLRFYEDLSVAETADVLECSPGTVKSQTAKALTLLRDRAPQLRELRRAWT